MNIYFKQQLDSIMGGILLAALKIPTVLLGVLLQRDHTLTLKHNVCFIKMQGGGSLVIAYPALLALRDKYKKCEFKLVCTKQVQHFAECLNIFDTIQVIDDSSPSALFFSGIIALYKVFRTDTVVDLEVYSRLTTVFSVVTCARNRIGFYLENTFWRKNICTQLVFFNRYSGAFCFYDQVAELFGVSPTIYEDWSPFLKLNKSNKYCSHKYIISISPFCSELGQERMLTPEQWRANFSYLLSQDTDYVVFILGGMHDYNKAEHIINVCTSLEHNVQFSNLCGTMTLHDSVQLISESNEFWGIDSGLLHFARLVGVKCTSFWGPTDPSTRLRAFPGLIERIFYCKVPCSPCIHVAEKTPCNGDNICIDSLFYGRETPHLVVTAKMASLDKDF